MVNKYMPEMFVMRDSTEMTKKEEFVCRIAEGNHNSNKQGYQQRRRNQAKWQKQWCKFGDAWLANHNDEGHIIG